MWFSVAILHPLRNHFIGLCPTDVLHFLPMTLLYNYLSVGIIKSYKAYAFRKESGVLETHVLPGNTQPNQQTISFEPVAHRGLSQDQCPPDAGVSWRNPSICTVASSGFSRFQNSFVDSKQNIPQGSKTMTAAGKEFETHPRLVPPNPWFSSPGSTCSKVFKTLMSLRQTIDGKKSPG